jgi:hypothetical protein
MSIYILGPVHSITFFRFSNVQIFLNLKMAKMAKMFQMIDQNWPK